ncbi:MAG TPA: hypothetical protein VLE46_09400 [Nitrospira sp.]|nr:hypothetical protein [Nitrospira sp.]
MPTAPASATDGDMSDHLERNRRLIEDVRDKQGSAKPSVMLRKSPNKVKTVLRLRPKQYWHLLETEVFSVTFPRYCELQE